MKGLERTDSLYADTELQYSPRYGISLFDRRQNVCADKQFVFLTILTNCVIFWEINYSSSLYGAASFYGMRAPYNITLTETTHIRRHMDIMKLGKLTL